LSHNHYDHTGGVEFLIDPQLRQKDDLPDDQALVLNTDEGLIVIVGSRFSLLDSGE